MTRLPDNIEQDFPKLTGKEQAELVQKLQRYVERGVWAQAILNRLHKLTAPKAHLPR